MPKNDLFVIIPAYDEQKNICSVIRKVKRYASDIIVVDDGSTDGTATVAVEAGAAVLTSEPLPDGWCGKTWACKQGAEASAGEVLLFVDADTWFEQNGLQKVTDTHLYERGAMSVAPYHKIKRPYEELSAFFNLMMTAGTGAFTILSENVVAGRGQRVTLLAALRQGPTQLPATFLQITDLD